MIATAAAAAMWLWLPYPAEARFALAVFGLAIASWIWLPVDDTVIAVAAAALMMLGGLVSFDAVAGAVTNPLLPLMAGAFVIAAALARSGVAERIVVATIGNARSVAGLFHIVSLLVLATAFVIPSTTARAALFLPAFLALAATIDDTRIVRALALLIPTTVLLSACVALTGAGAHLVASDFIARLDGPVIGPLQWTMVGLPFGLVSCALATEAILRLFLGAGTRRSAPAMPRPSGQPFGRTQQTTAAVAAGMVAAFAGSTMIDLDPALISVVAAALLVIGPFRVLAPVEALRSVEWRLLAFLLATMLMGDALVTSGAAHAVTAGLVASINGDMLRNPLVIVVIVATIALLSHLLITSRTARAAILIPVLAIPLSGAGYDVTALILLIAIGTGFCQTLPVSAKAVALYAALKQPTYTPRDLLLLSGVLLPIHFGLLVVFALLVWPMLGLPLQR